MTSRDCHRSDVYSAETIFGRMLNNCAASSNPLVAIDGVALTLPPEAKFASVEDVGRYIDRLLSWQPLIDTFGPPRSVHVRARRSTQPRAHYDPDRAVIAIPDEPSMLRELVVLHELSHHLDRSDGPDHGPGFLNTYLTLLALVMAPEAALALRLLLAHHGVSTATGAA